MRVKAISFLLAAAIISAAVTSCSRGQNTKASADGPQEQQLFIGDSIAIAQTQYGKVRGYILSDVYYYLGIPYGATTAGENRFMPPKPPKPWSGIRNAVYPGNVAPQVVYPRFNNALDSFKMHWESSDPDDDCLFLNVWTPKPDGEKRPVIVWMHGGGYSSGNAVEQDGYTGPNLVRYGNVVFVSMNHRVGPFGFSDFSAVDPKFADSGNVGMLDLVAALQWVHDNIANFGGDPGNVTIIGQSGGGAKVCDVMAMPESEGLVHKVVGLSGNAVEAMDQSVSSEIGRRIWEAGGRSMEKLQSMPWQEYNTLAYKVSSEYAKEKGMGRQLGGSFAPVADGKHLPVGTFFTDPDAASARIPLLLCSTTSEFTWTTADAALEDIDKEGAIKVLSNRGIKNAAEVYEAFSKVFPDEKPIQAIGMATGFRKKVIDAANIKYNQGGAPVYVAYFGWTSPLFDNRDRAPHCMDICFWFNNTDLMITHTGGGARPRILSHRMADALLQFMKTGDPNTPSLPHWDEYDPTTQATMYLDDECKMYHNLDTDAIKTLD